MTTDIKRDTVNIDDADDRLWLDFFNKLLAHRQTDKGSQKLVKQIRKKTGTGRF